MDQKKTILIVDDDESTRKSLALIFDKMGYEMEAVGTGQEGLEKARARFFNVAMLDIRLPDIEGVDLIAPLKEMHPDMAVIVVTAYASVQTSMRALNEGASAYMSKPLDLNHVLATVAEALDKQRVVDEKRRAEQALRESEEKYRDLVENINDVIYTIDGNGVLMYINPAVELCLGYSPSELEGQSFAPFLHEEDAQRAMDGFVSLLSGRPTTGEYRLLAKSGEFRWMRTSNRPVLEGDRVIGATGVLTDITERKEAEEALRGSENRLKLIYNNVSDEIVLVDTTGRILDTNRRVTDIFGLSPDEVLGRNFADLDVFDTGQLSDMIRLFADSVSRQTVQPVTKFRAKHKDGSVIVVEVVATTVSGVGEAVDGFLLLVRDVTERERGEQALRESEDRYRSFVQNFRGITFRTKGDFTPDFFHGAVEEITGYTEAEFTAGKPRWDQIIHPDDLPEMGESAQRLMSTPGVSAEVEHRILRKDGGVRWVLEAVQSVPDESGKLAYIQGVIIDITERKKAEEALRDSEEKYRDLFENANDLIQSVNMEGRFEYVNPRWLEVMGYSREELEYLRLTDILRQDQVPHCMELFKRVVSGERLEHVETVFMTKDGREIFVEGNVGSSTRDGEFVATRGIFRDVSERKRAEEALKNRERQYRLVTENVADVIWTVDMQFRPTYVSPSITELLGYSMEEAMAKTTEDIYAPESLELAMNVFEEEMSREATDPGYVAKSRTLELELNHKDGSKVLVEGKFTLIRNADGHPCEILAVVRDITARKQAEEELARVKREKDAQIVQSAKLASLGEMATGIAHEINQPLSIIKLACSGLNRSMKRGKTITPEMVSEELRSIDDQVERMRVIIDHMRTFARRSSDTKSEHVDMNVPLNGCFNFVGEQLRLREIDVELDLQELPQVKADSNKLEQVFLNIIGNARDAMDEFAERAGSDYKKAIKVRSFADNGNAVVTFTDTGGGIPEYIRDRVFEPFFTTKEVGKGTGLGLSVSYSIIKGFGGDLEFSVEDGVGTTFRVAVPTVNRDPSTDKDPCSSPA